jgi:F0F1-type ATP synthase assembly protein I
MKRTLRPSIQTFIEVVSIIILIMLASINDFELSALPFILTLLTVLIVNGLILICYGKQ